MKPMNKENGIKKYYYEDSNRVWCTEDNKNGIHTFYDFDGNIEEIRYFDGSKQIKIEKYHKGVKTEDCPYDGVVIHGTLRQYYASSGGLMNAIEYKRGKRDGMSVSYNEDGSLISIRNWKNEQQHGVAKVYTEASRDAKDFNNKKYIRRIEYYLNGKEVTIEEYRKVMPLSDDDIMPIKISFDEKEMSPQILKNEGYTTFLLGDQNDKFYTECGKNLYHFKKEFKLIFYWVEVYVYYGRIIPLRHMSLRDDITEEELDELYYQSCLNFEFRNK